jgi:uncharacterized membrane protein (DUF485 family)
MSIVNKPKVSKAIAATYEVLLALIMALMVLFAYLTVFTPMELIAGVVVLIVLAFVGLVMTLILASVYRTCYALTDDELVIRTTRLIGGSKAVPLKTINSVEKTVIPFGIRLFGDSFHGGYYYIPSIGKTFMAITNFQDGLLIKTERGNYVITPSKPLDFKKIIESKIRDSG